MIVYWPTRPANSLGIKVIAIAPAFTDPSTRVEGWVDDDGKPVTFNIVFKDGKADVTDELGRFLIDQKRAVARQPAVIYG